MYNNVIIFRLRAGIKILLDFVPNHTSDEHEWFQKSIKKIEPFTDYYIWKDPVIDQHGNKTPPSNWVSYMNAIVIICAYYILFSDTAIVLAVK